MLQWDGAELIPRERQRGKMSAWPSPECDQGSRTPTSPDCPDQGTPCRHLEPRAPFQLVPGPCWLCHRETWQELSFVSHLVPVWRALLCFPWEQVLVLGTLLHLECPAPDSSWMCKYPLCSKSGLMACGPSPAWAIFLWDLLPFLHRRCEKCCKNRLLMHLPSAFNSSCWDSDLRGSDPTLVTLWRVASRTQ